MNSIVNSPIFTSSGVLAAVKEYHHAEKEMFSAAYIDNCPDILKEIGSKIEGFTVDDLFQKPLSDSTIPPNTWGIKYQEFRLLGIYIPKTRHIHYFGNEPEELPITMVHERCHAIHHLTKDKKGNHWRQFAHVSAFYADLLAQLETYCYCRAYKPVLLPLFLELSKSQPFVYQTWRLFEMWPAQKVKDLYWYIRNNPRKLNGPGLLGQISQKIASSIIPASRINPAIAQIVSTHPLVCKPRKKYR